MIVRLLTEALKLRLSRRAEADSENKEAVGKMVECAGFAREFPWPSPGNRRDHRSQENALGRCGDRCKHDPCVGQWNGGRAVEQQMIPKKKSVPPRCLRRAGQLQQIVGIRELTEIRSVDTKPHDGDPLFRENIRSCDKGERGRMIGSRKVRDTSSQLLPAFPKRALR